MEQHFTQWPDELLTLSPQYVMVSCLTHEDGVGWSRGSVVRRKELGVGGAILLGESRVGGY